MRKSEPPARSAVTVAQALYDEPRDLARHEQEFLTAVHRITMQWRRVLQHRSHKAEMTWDRMRKLANDWLPRPRILHPWPSKRFAVRHPRWEPYARIGHVRFCAGGAQ